MTLTRINSNGITDGSVNTADLSFDAGALGARNRIINGDMRIDQRNAGAAVTATNAGIYTVDRWVAIEDTDGTYTVQQSTTAPAGFTHSLLATIGTADTSLAATQYAVVAQRIEGFNTADLGWGAAGAGTVTLSFWVRSSLTGTFGGSFSNSDNTRSYPFTYAISAANTWERKSLTVLGDTSGTWLKDNGRGIGIHFSLGTGSTYSGTAGAWAGSNFVNATGSVNLIGTAGATFYITGVQLEAGTVATPFERRSYGQELSLCQRYCTRWQYGSRDTNFLFQRNANTTTYWSALTIPTPMRAWPSATFFQSNNWNVISGSGYTCSSRTIGVGAVHGPNDQITSISIGFDMTGFGAGSWDLQGIRSNHNDAANTPYIVFSSEL